MATPDKAILGLLNGLAKREYYNEDDITDDFLHKELFEDLSEEEFPAILKRFQGILATLATSDMNYGQLEAYLTSQMKRREATQNLTEGQASSVMKFWRNHKSKIHDVVVVRNQYSSHLKELNWRIDLMSQERYVQQTNEPCAIVELHIDDKNAGKGNAEGSGKLQFEMSLQQVEKMVESLDKIEQRLATFSEE